MKDAHNKASWPGGTNFHTVVVLDHKQQDLKKNLTTKVSKQKRSTWPQRGTPIDCRAQRCLSEPSHPGDFALTKLSLSSSQTAPKSHHRSCEANTNSFLGNSSILPFLSITHTRTPEHQAPLGPTTPDPTSSCLLLFVGTNAQHCRSPPFEIKKRNGRETGERRRLGS